MIGYMLLYVSYTYHFVCLVTCIVLISLVSIIVHLCLILGVYVCLWLITNCLCMLMFACGQVYNGVMVVVTHEVVVCIVDKVMH